MSDVRYSFSMREVLALLIVESGVTEGNWALSFGFSMTAGNMPDLDGKEKPSAVTMLHKIEITRAKPNSTPDLTMSVIEAKARMNNAQDAKND